MNTVQHKENGFGNGFLLGVVVGVLITLMFTTKKGKKILNMLTESGMETMSDFEGFFNDIAEDYKSENAPAPKTKTSPKIQLQKALVPEEEELVVSPQVHHEPAKSQKRFFKGVSRRSIN